MLAYLKANFDLIDIYSFDFNVQTNQLRVRGADQTGQTVTKTQVLSPMDGARLFRLHAMMLPGL